MARIGESQVVANAGSTLQNDLFTGAEGAITYDFQRQTVRLHDGQTAGGREIQEGAFRSVATDFSDLDALVTVGLILNRLIPLGIIVKWSGSEASIPTGWKLCNGLNGTPDLRNCFIVGAGGTDSGGQYLPGVTGGGTTTTTDFQGSHSHSGVTDPAGGHLHLGNTDINGEHLHFGTAISSGGHTHSVTTAPAILTHSHNFSMDIVSHTHSALNTSAPTSVNHTHTAQSNTSGSSTQTIWLDTVATGGLTLIAAVDSVFPPAGRPNAVNIILTTHTHTTGNPVAGSALSTHTHGYNPTPTASGAHNHPATVGLSDSGGGSDSTSHAHTGTAIIDGIHTHGVNVDEGGSHLHSFTTNYEAEHVHNITATSFSGNHQHTISDNRPQFYALCFMQYVGS